MNVKKWLNRIAKCFVNCPGCGSGNVSGGPPYMCRNCGSIWQ